MQQSINKIKHSDKNEREEALDPSQSFIVQAPAGSGKTELLIRRFLLLLSKVDRPEEILSITFTRKAAAEMRTRILDALKMSMKEQVVGTSCNNRRLELAGDALSQDRKKKWNLLENPARLKIMTIDSLCASFTRQMPLLARLGSQPVIEDNPEALYRETARRTILMVEERSENGRAIQYILKHMDNSISGLEDRLVAMLEKRDQWSRHLCGKVDPDELNNYIKNSLRKLCEWRLKEAWSKFPEEHIKTLASCIKWSAQNWPDKKTEKIVEEINHPAASGQGKNAKINSTKTTREDAGNISHWDLKNIDSIPGPEINNLPKWKWIANLLLTSNNEWRKPGGVTKNIGFPNIKSDEPVFHKNLFKKLLETLSINNKLLSAFYEVKLLPTPLYSKEQEEMMKALMLILPRAVNILRDVFTEQGKIDFTGISQAAISVLGPEDNPTDLMLSLDLRIQHILVDEYQDTSQVQSALLKSLTSGWVDGDGRTLFLVGDPMQSIYLFRDADAGLFFNTKKNGIGNIKLKSLNLSSNFRSDTNLVNWFNSCFKPVFSREDDFLGAIPYSPFKPMRPEEGIGAKFYPFYERDDAAEAEKVVEIINEIIKKNDSLAILVQSRSHLQQIIAVLKENGIEYRSQKIDHLSERPVVLDLLSLLKAFQNPFDRIAWLSLLRSPMCGLALKEIHTICFNEPKKAIWELITDKVKSASLSEDGKKRLNRFVENMLIGMNYRGCFNIRKLLEGTWLSLNGPACVSDADFENAALFFDMVESLSEGGELRSLNELELAIKKLYANPVGKEKKAVEIMTIHEAKGLEFNNVIIPGLGKKAQTSKKNLLLWLEKEENLFIAPVKRKDADEEDEIYDYFNYLYKQRFKYEKGRLLYVAMTRAKKGLHLLGHVKRGKPESNSLLSIIWPKLKQELKEPASEKPKETLESKISFKLNRLPSSWEIPIPAEGLPIKVRAKKKVSKIEKLEFQWAGENAKHLGTVLHKFFKRITVEGLELWDLHRVKKERPKIKAMLLQLGLPDYNISQLADKGVNVLGKTLQDKKGRWILSKHLEESSEVSLTGVSEGNLIQGVIDRTFIDEAGIRWIIDYKTGSHEGGLLEEYLKTEQERYKDQLEQYADLLISAGENRKIKKGLYFPALSKWIEW